MGNDRQTFVIKATAPPPGEKVTASVDEIAEWMRNTDPTAVENAAFAYGNAAGTVKLMADAIEARAKRLSEAWQGPVAADVQKAMQYLSAAGTELFDKMDEMARALRLYSQLHLPEAKAKIQQIQIDLQAELPCCTPPANPSGTSTRPSLTDTTGQSSPPVAQSPFDGTGGGSTGIPRSLTPQTGIKNEATYQLAKAYADGEARKVLNTLNEQIVEVYNLHVPQYVTYELPKVEPEKGGPAPQRKVDYGDTPPYTGGAGPSGRDPGGTTAAASWGNSGGADGSGSGSGSGGSGAAGTGGDPSGGATGNDGTGGDTTPDTPADSGDGTGGDSGSDPGGTAAGGDTGGSNGGTDAGDGTAPPVIGQDGASAGSDSQSTEVAGVSDPPVTTPLSTDPGNGRSVTPGNVIGSVKGPGAVAPGVPSILGEPVSGTGVIGQPNLTVPRGPANGSMMPFMPMGGASGAGDSGGEERTTWLTEERDAWDSSHRVIPPVIG